MSWNRTGEQVSGTYCGEPYTGTVESSRVKYGGSVQHCIRLNTPITVFGGIRYVVLALENELDG